MTHEHRGDTMGRPEDERVKIPALLHLTRHGYQYVSLKEASYDEETNIFAAVFRDAISRLNHRAFSDTEAAAIIQEIKRTSPQGIYLIIQ